MGEQNSAHPNRYLYARTLIMVYSPQHTYISPGTAAGTSSIQCSECHCYRSVTDTGILQCFCIYTVVLGLIDCQLRAPKNVMKVLCIQRKQGPVAATSGRMGFIEYNDLRGEAMEATRRGRQEMLDQAAMKAANLAGKSLCCIQ
jgi:hypothetical protein